MTTPAVLLRRVEQLEADVRAGLALAEGRGREPGALDRRQVFLAVTKRVGGAYPGAGNTFGLQFVDREFTPTEGTQAATNHTRSATKQAIGRTLTGDYLAEGTLVVAIPAPVPAGTSGKGRWHILQLPQTPIQIYLGVANANIAQGSTTGSVSRLDGGTEADTLIDDTVINKWPAITAGSFVIYADIGAAKYVLAPSGGGASTPLGTPFINNGGPPIGPFAPMWATDTSLVADTSYVLTEYPGQQFDTLWLVNGATTVAFEENSLGFWRTEISGPVAIDPDLDGLIVAGMELGVMPGQALLTINRPGFTALGGTYDIDGTLVVDCRQRVVDSVFGKFRTSVTQNAAGNVTAEFDLWRRIAGMREAAGWEPIVGYPHFLGKNDQIKAGTWGRGDWWTDGWELDGACDVDDTDAAQASPGAQEQQFLFTGPDTSVSTNLTQQIQQGTI